MIRRALAFAVIAWLTLSAASFGLQLYLNHQSDVREEQDEADDHAAAIQTCQLTNDRVVRINSSLVAPTHILAQASVVTRRREAEAVEGNDPERAERLREQADVFADARRSVNTVDLIRCHNLHPKEGEPQRPLLRRVSLARLLKRQEAMGNLLESVAGPARSLLDGIGSIVAPSGGPDDDAGSPPGGGGSSSGPGGSGGNPGGNRPPGPVPPAGCGDLPSICSVRDLLNELDKRLELP